MEQEVARSYSVTINNWTQEEYDLLADDKTAKYTLIGQEGKDATPHLQCFIQYKSPKRFTTLKERYPRAHIEVAKGNHQANFKYCTKEGNWQEYGTRPLTPKEKGDKGKEFWNNVMDLAKAGKLDEIDTATRIRYKRTLEEIAEENKPQPTESQDVTGIWYYGEPGVGKSRKARELFPGAYLKMCNKWWDYYQNQPYVIIDDFEKEHKVLGHHLKIWADRYPFLAEIKGGARVIRPEKIIITSNYVPEDIWDDPATIKAIRRRFIFTHIQSPLEPPPTKKPRIPIVIPDIINSP